MDAGSLQSLILATLLAVECLLKRKNCSMATESPEYNAPVPFLQLRHLTFLRTLLKLQLNDLVGAGNGGLFTTETTAQFCKIKVLRT